MPTSHHPSLRRATDLNASRSRLHVHFSQSCIIPLLTYQSTLHHVISMLHPRTYPWHHRLRYVTAQLQPAQCPPQS
ncbi:hypothetical protein M405DRAFT_938879 [Rhizopogon salebrosus TDB-379]|nr:hypothetical protein M405DRAFT_938879 [Rhizopogon salebrosus TDB-379]